MYIKLLSKTIIFISTLMSFTTTQAMSLNNEISVELRCQPNGTEVPIVYLTGKKPLSSQAVSLTSFRIDTKPYPNPGDIYYFIDIEKYRSHAYFGQHLDNPGYSRTAHLIASYYVREKNNNNQWANQYKNGAGIGASLVSIDNSRDSNKNLIAMIAKVNDPDNEMTLVISRGNNSPRAAVDINIAATNIAHAMQFVLAQDLTQATFKVGTAVYRMNCENAKSPFVFAYSHF